MSRKQLDIVFAGGAVVLAVLFLVLGFVLISQKNFADDYVKTELSAQKIYFTSTEGLAADAKANPDNAVLDWKPGSSCLTEYAGQLMETGKQAECYAKYYIAMHMSRSAENLKFSAPIDVTLGNGTETLTSMEGQTYATIGTIRSALAADQKKLAEAGDKTAADARQKDVDAAAGLRTSMQTGETLRGLLLTSFGFSTFGDKAGLAATVAFLAAALVFLIGVAGFVHAFVFTKEGKAKDATATAPNTPGLNPR
jgi:hypothetical protein